MVTHVSMLVIFSQLSVLFLYWQIQKKRKARFIKYRRTVVTIIRLFHLFLLICLLIKNLL